MSASLLLRVPGAMLGALLITVAVFLFMQSLIRYSQQEGEQLAVYENLQILPVEPDSLEPEPEDIRAEQPRDEPSAEPLELPQFSAVTPEPAATLEFDALALASGDVAVPTPGDRWSAPLAGGVATLGGGGEDGRGYVEVTPFNTRRPNVPEVAWQNKIDGWVLVAFSVTPEGITRSVRVLDASPRGVFEEKVIAAIEDWRYRVSFSGKISGDIVLTQKVEVLWKNYPQNLPNVD